MGQRLKHFLKVIIRFILYPLSFPFIEKILKKKIKKNSNDYKSLWNLAICYFVFKRYLEAQVTLEALVKIRPDPQYIKYLSRVYFNREQYNKVVETLSNPGILTDRDKENYYL
jgi:tetratricopeptide (TPR) repeat protein